MAVSLSGLSAASGAREIEEYIESLAVMLLRQDHESTYLMYDMIVQSFEPAEFFQLPQRVLDLLLEARKAIIDNWDSNGPEHDHLAIMDNTPF